MVMEYVPGKTLEVVEREHGPLPWQIGFHFLKRYWMPSSRRTISVFCIATSNRQIDANDLGRAQGHGIRHRPHARHGAHDH